MTKKEALLEINETQDFYVSKLSDIITGEDNRFEDLKEIDFTSPTGTGKTVMVAKLINSLPNFFFVITSLSRGQLRYQVEGKIRDLCKGNNFVVFGLNEYTKNTILQEKDIIYGRMPQNDYEIVLDKLVFDKSTMTQAKNIGILNEQDFLKIVYLYVR